MIIRNLKILLWIRDRIKIFLSFINFIRIQKLKSLKSIASNRLFKYYIMPLYLKIMITKSIIIIRTNETNINYKKFIIKQ
jgi:hypothetical protein